MRRAVAPERLEDMSDVLAHHYTTALDLNGKIIWQQKICDYVTHQGFGSSPVLHENLVIVSADHRGGGVIAALNRETGKVVWSQDRPKLPASHHSHLDNRYRWRMSRWFRRRPPRRS